MISAPWLRFLRPARLVTSGLILAAGLLVLSVGSFRDAAAVGGAIGGVGAGALLTELIAVGDRPLAAERARAETLAFERLGATAIFARFRTAAELGAVATRCLFGTEEPLPAYRSRFSDLCEALDLSRQIQQGIPPAGHERELEGYDRYKTIRRALVDRHGETVAGVFAFVFTSGILVGGSTPPDEEDRRGMSEKVRDTLFDLPDGWLRVSVAQMLGAWEQGKCSTLDLASHLNGVTFWLENYGSQRQVVQDVEQALRRSRGDPGRWSSLSDGLGDGLW